MDERIIRMKLDLLRRKSVVRHSLVSSCEARSADHVGPDAYHYDGPWAPVWGESAWPAGKTLFVRGCCEEAMEGSSQSTYLHFHMDGLEGLLSIEGLPYAGIDSRHPRVVLPAARPIHWQAEFMCVGASLSRPELQGERARLQEIAIIDVDLAIEAAHYDLWFAWEACLAARDERRRRLLSAALEESLLAIDLTAEPAEFRRQVATARTILRQRISAIQPDPEGGRIFLTGHSHIDTAWLWPLRETIRKCGRTFATACRLLERYPSYHFSCSQPQLYAYTKRYYPALYEEIKRWVRSGRWECTGGMWVESDCNVPSGESLIRQILHGLRFFRDEFGQRPRTCWLPDVFGYPASLPQILAGCGLTQFMTNKLHWQARNPFPAHLFWWEGIDGTRLLAHIPRLKGYYNGWPNPDELAFAWEHYEQKADHGELLFPFGHGDGGGGPTEEMLEFAERASAFPGIPACRQGPEQRYFDDARQATPTLPVWVGELYLETHRGTYTTQSAVKRANRKNELALRDAEILSAFATLAGKDVDMSPLRAAWENLLLLQFHDILPGSSIGEVYREAARDHAQIAATAHAVHDIALGALASQVGAKGDLLVVNTLSWPRQDVVNASVPHLDRPIEVVDAQGHAVPAQVTGLQGDQDEIVFVPTEVPSMGLASYVPRPANNPEEHSLRASTTGIESRFYSLELAPDGTITRLLDKRHGREVIDPAMPGNALQLFQDGPEREAAWNVHATFEQRSYPWDAGAQIEVVERGPVRAAVRVRRHYRNTTVQQDIVLYDRLPRIDFATTVDWQERQTMLKVAFPVQVRSSHATFEIQFGAVERPTHRNTSWEQAKFEVCAHRWMDLSEAGYGVSLLNDCKYGGDVRDNVLRLTLLRSPEWPDPDADRGRHEFTYSLLPHSGDWRVGETVRRAMELNVPLLCIPGHCTRPGASPAHSFFTVDGPAILETIKPADDGDGWVLRLYEPNGGRDSVRLGVQPLAAGRTVQSWARCDLVERRLSRGRRLPNAPQLAIRPFEIVAYRFRIL